MNFFVYSENFMMSLNKKKIIVRTGFESATFSLSFSLSILAVPSEYIHTHTHTHTLQRVKANKCRYFTVGLPQPVCEKRLFSIQRTSLHRERERIG